MKPDVQQRTVSTSPNHKHRWDPLQIKNSFEPVIKDAAGVWMYEMIEYAFMACTCGAVVKSRVKNRETHAEQE